MRSSWRKPGPRPRKRVRGVVQRVHRTPTEWREIMARFRTAGGTPASTRLFSATWARMSGFGTPLIATLAGRTEAVLRPSLARRERKDATSVRSGKKKAAGLERKPAAWSDQSWSKGSEIASLRSGFLGRFTGTTISKRCYGSIAGHRKIVSFCNCAAWRTPCPAHGGWRSMLSRSRASSRTPGSLVATWWPSRAVCGRWRSPQSRQPEVEARFRKPGHGGRGPGRTRPGTGVNAR